MTKYRYINYKVDDEKYPRVIKINITDGQHFSDKMEVYYALEGEREINENQIEIINSATFTEK